MREQLKRKAVALVNQRVPNWVALYLFGSQAHHATHSDSDLDLALLASTPQDAQTRWDLEQDLSRILGQAVDLIDLLQASTVFRQQVISTATLLAEKQPSERERFEVWVHSAYTRLNEERREILADIEQRGSVYGR